MDLTQRGRREHAPTTRLASLAAAALIVASCAASAGPSAGETPSGSFAAPTPIATPSLAPSGVIPPEPPATARPTPAPTPGPPAAGDETLAAVYAALRPENLRTMSGPRVLARGAPITMVFEIVNRSSATIEVPLTTAFDRPASWYGVLQTWIERLGDDPTLVACLPNAGRKGRWYATGGTSAAFGAAASGPIQPGAGTTVRYGISNPESTSCLPAGRYRYHVEYRRFDAAVDDVIAAQSLDFELRNPTGWTIGGEGDRGGRSTLRLSGSGTELTSSLRLHGLAPKGRVTFEVRAGGCEREGAVIVPATTFTAAADGTITDRSRVKLTRSARRAIAAGEMLGLRLTEGTHRSCARYLVLPIALPADRAPTTWGGGHLRETVEGVVITASSETLYGRPSQAIDANLDDMWNAGGYPPAWVELDLGRNTRLTGLRLLPSQLPSVADTLHRVYGRKDGSRTEVLLAELKGTTRDNTWIDVAFAKTERIRYLRIATLTSPSWVAWREIRIEGPDQPPPSTMPQGTHDGALGTFAIGDRCYANGWASDPDDRTREVTVRILVDDEEVWRGPALQPRQDVHDAGMGDWTTGFWVPLERLLRRGVTHVITAQALDEETGRWVNLAATPRSLMCG